MTPVGRVGEPDEASARARGGEPHGASSRALGSDVLWVVQGGGAQIRAGGLARGSTYAGAPADAGGLGPREG